MIKSIIRQVILLAASVAAFSACNDMKEDLAQCPQGLDIHFRYDYNLESANMFADHVGSVTVYLFDQQGHYLDQKTVSNTTTSRPLANKDFAVHFDVAPGTYHYEAVAMQKPYDDCINAAGAKFRLDKPMQPGSTMHDLGLTLDAQPIAGVTDTLLVDNQGMPLDTLWMGRKENVVVKYNTVPTTQSDTCSLVRDTKQITVTLRDLDSPYEIYADDYDFSITDRNAHILWDNAVDSVTDTRIIRYTPFAQWETADKPATSSLHRATEQNGKMVHASLMTSRIKNHELGKDDMRFRIFNKKTQNVSVDVNLVDLLCRDRFAALINRWRNQEYLDRCHDYHLTFYLKGDSWSYVSIQIGVLSWTVHYQREEL